MSRRLLDELGRAHQCLELLASLGAAVRDVRIHRRYGTTITLDDTGTLADHLDRTQTPVLCGTQSQLAVVNDCLVAWSAR